MLILSPPGVTPNYLATNRLIDVALAVFKFQDSILFLH